MTSGDTAGPSGPRRRGKVLEQAIFQATLDELVAVGYARLSMEAVAVGARTGKAAIYRRWPSKEELVLDTLRATLPEPGPAPDTGGLRGDLLELVTRSRAAMISLPGCAGRVIMGELDHERAEPFMGLMHQRVIAPSKSLLRDVLARGALRGEVRADANNPLVIDVIPALMMYRAKVHGPPAEAEVVELVDQVLLPMVRARAEAAGPPAVG
ncbi:TetR/AcrR family transcriptional regulator [Streptacidiphilus cavernicola]|uniref:TetR/AcrR family transcriptional regulator n=1 Tax=Streptacidiphilus cavernicola TaxID=3342716 RepID=A0ABV6W1L5_9ACTN